MWKYNVIIFSNDLKKYPYFLKTAIIPTQNFKKLQNKLSRSNYSY